MRTIPAGERIFGRRIIQVPVPLADIRREGTEQEHAGRPWNGVAAADAQRSLYS
jgi:hypothetical protein